MQYLYLDILHTWMLYSTCRAHLCPGPGCTAPGQRPPHQSFLRASPSESEPGLPRLGRIGRLVGNTHPTLGQPLLPTQMHRHTCIHTCIHTYLHTYILRLVHAASFAALQAPSHAAGVCMGPSTTWMTARAGFAPGGFRRWQHQWLLVGEHQPEPTTAPARVSSTALAPSRPFRPA